LRRVFRWGLPPTTTTPNEIPPKTTYAKNNITLLKKTNGREIIQLYLRAWNTQESIAEEVNCNQPTISRVLENFMKNGKFPKIHKDFKPKISGSTLVLIMSLNIIPLKIS